MSNCHLFEISMIPYGVFSKDSFVFNSSRHKKLILWVMGDFYA